MEDGRLLYVHRTEANRERFWWNLYYCLVTPYFVPFLACFGCYSHVEQETLADRTAGTVRVDRRPTCFLFACCCWCMRQQMEVHNAVGVVEDKRIVRVVRNLGAPPPLELMSDEEEAQFQLHAAEFRLPHSDPIFPDHGYDANSWRYQLISPSLRRDAVYALNRYFDVSSQQLKEMQNPSLRAKRVEQRKQQQEAELARQQHVQLASRTICRRVSTTLLAHPNCAFTDSQLTTILKGALDSHPDFLLKLSSPDAADLMLELCTHLSQQLAGAVLHPDEQALADDTTLSLRAFFVGLEKKAQAEAKDDQRRREIKTMTERAHQQASQPQNSASCSSSSSGSGGADASASPARSTAVKVKEQADAVQGVAMAATAVRTLLGV